MRRTSCSGCGNADLDMFLNLGNSPIADAYTTNANDLVAYHPLELAVCSKCRLVQLLEVVDHKTLFGTGYSFYSSASPPLSAYHAQYAKDVLNQYSDLAQRSTLEIGCNDGDMLRWFAQADCRTLGVDPASGPVAVARDRGLDVREYPFSLVNACHIRNDFGQAGVVIANHVLAHVEDVSDVLAGIAHVLADDGVAFIEVQYLPDLLVNNAFDLVYHEHRNFFSLSSLEQAALQHDLHITNAWLTDRQGGSLRVTLSKNTRDNTAVSSLRQSESWLRAWGAYEGMQGRVEHIRERLLNLIDDEILAGHVIAGYGAPAKATTLLNFCGINAGMLAYVVDTTVAKQGRYIPGTHGIRIISPDLIKDGWAQPDTFVLLSWNYLSTIIRDNLQFTANGGHWIVPIPTPVLL